MKPVEQEIRFPDLEERVLAFWQREGIFQKSLDPSLSSSISGAARDEPRPSYVFYDGPPFATGLPHYGHLLAGTIKDVVGRFFTMKGFHVDRRCGWDCHGVPVEFEIQKKLDLHGNRAITDYGIDKFNEACREIVLRYTGEWQQFLERSGRWVDFERQYRTMDLEFMESIWWVVKSLWDKGLLYEGVKCVPYSWAMNTPLSNFEANLNYKNVQDPAVTVRVLATGGIPEKFLAVTSDPIYLYLWTTTPWTLPSNMAVAVGAEIKYGLVERADTGEVFVAALERLESLLPKDCEFKTLLEFTGAEAVGIEYEPLFNYFSEEKEKNAFRIYSAEYVTEGDGTGLVHLASFGEDDLAIFKANGISIIDPVDEDGSFKSEVSDFAGLNVKEADSKIVAWLKENGGLVDHRTIEHSYPFCWRTDTPLIYKSIPTWFVNVEKFRDDLEKVNKEIHWVPEHLRDGRMGKWLEGARDWAISRNRFWGTPIPVWRCSGCGELECLGSLAELEEKTKAKVTDLHRHFIDDLTMSCGSCGADMKRIDEVLDCWFESGSMPYAQAHYPFENQEVFEANFPADFIAEGLDQTRGWFYTLLILSTALFEKPAFKNVIVNGILLAEDGKKMSKSLQNYPPPDEVMNESGADAMRLYLLSSAATRGEELRFSKDGVQQVVRQTLLPLWNAYNFFVTYALVDKWTPDNVPEQPSDNLLDRWILSKVGSLTEKVDSAMGEYHLYATVQPILDFVDQLTNWYIRLNRRRFWSGETEAERLDKQHAYSTLHQALVSFTQVLAPLAPFISEEIFLNLTEGMKDVDCQSVHLAPFPEAGELRGVQVDSGLEQSMELFEEVILLSRGLRNDLGLKVRQPLASVKIVYPEVGVLEGVKAFDSYIREELNIKSVEYSSDETGVVNLKALLNTKALGKVLGPKLGSSGMKELRNFVQGLSTDEIRAFETGGKLDFKNISLGTGDIIVRRDASDGAENVASSGQITVVLDTSLTPELESEGLAREFVNRVQRLRKDSNFHVSDRIKLKFSTDCPDISKALGNYEEYIRSETLTLELLKIDSEDELKEDSESQNIFSQEIDGKNIMVCLSKVID